MESLPPICAEGGSGMILPLSSQEHHWNPLLRGTLYAIGMVYVFLGIAMIADTFVQSIENITSSWTQVLDPRRGMLYTKKVWNETVATLTLMALGSSAPEIAIAVIDVFKNDYHYAALGTSTILGSAAFNLLVIIAVCVVVVPDARRIEFLPAFHVTAFFSVCAYLWMAFVLKVSTPNVVDIWEAGFTLLMFPLLVSVSYKVDMFFRHLPIDDRSIEVINDEGEAPTLAFSVTPKVKRLSYTMQPSLALASNSRTSTNSSTNICVARKITDTNINVKSDLPTDLEISIVRDGEDLDIPTSCRYVVEEYTSTEGYDFIVDAEPTDTGDDNVKCALVDKENQMLYFGPSAEEATLKIHIPWRNPYKASRKFLVVLEGIEGGMFNPDTDGGAANCILTISLPSGGDGCLRFLDEWINFDACARGLRDWYEQLRMCIYCNGSPEEQSEASTGEFLMHLVSLPWKLVFCAVPPTTMYHGWPAFFTCLGFIGLTSSIVSDMAEIFGCIVSVPDEVTAVTFVALGTSMPDLFASREAAVSDPNADASVVNVTGSNSVNVFLGLGFPWLVASIHWSIVGRTDEWARRYDGLIDDCVSGFVVESGNITFMVLVFTFMAMLACFVLMMRRRWLGAELGGPFAPKVATSATFTLYWVVFIVLSSWNGLKRDASSEMEMGIVVGGGLGASVLLTLVLMLILNAYKPKVRLSDLSKEQQRSSEAIVEDLATSSGCSRQSEAQAESLALGKFSL
eukprot:TRINITY_DN71885_c0_g1_i1.p1 TRINITY_DN71885_c0_g1~~TRINITY_DN71885_c0_g1_i1.p1  ORF type:complete len:740 (+),score=80.91 TRINITY_DN71885_c0_g1_i1:71-2290(+)